MTTFALRADMRVFVYLIWKLTDYFHWIPPIPAENYVLHDRQCLQNSRTRVELENLRSPSRSHKGVWPARLHPHFKVRDEGGRNEGRTVFGWGQYRGGKWAYIYIRVSPLCLECLSKWILDLSEHVCSQRLAHPSRQHQDGIALANSTCGPPVNAS